MGFLKTLSGYKRYILGVAAMGLAALGAVPPEWQNWSLGIAGALAMATKAIDSLIPSET